MKLSTALCVALFPLALSRPLFSSEDRDDNWPHWRGPLATGEAINGAPPVEWSETHNIKWKTPIPGKGLSTPVIWGDQLFITTAIELDQRATQEAIERHKDSSPAFGKLLRMSRTTANWLQFVVYSIDRENGAINWTAVVREQYPHEGVQKNGSWASASCVTDGHHVVASFGSYGIYCFDMDGSLVWERDLGDMQVAMAFGEGASPVIYQDKLIVIWDHEGQSRVYALSMESGDDIWHRDRDEVTTWATPIVVEVDGRGQVVVPGKNMSTSYDVANGDVIWDITGLPGDVIPSPVSDGRMAFLMTGTMGAKKMAQAIDLVTARGHLGDSDAVVWAHDRKPSYVPSPLLVGERLYYLKGSSSRLSCVEASTGEIHYDAQRPEGMKSAYASPVCANGFIYIVDRKGNCSVVREGTEFEVVARNRLDDRFDASPAIVGNELFVRGLESLYCISE